MFERFTERARQVIILAQDEARVMKHGEIGIEHIFLGLILEEEGVAARVLSALDVTLDEAREKVRRIIPAVELPVVGQIPFSVLARKVMEGALREALSLGHNYIGTEHLLLALVRDDSTSAWVLDEFKVDHAVIRNEVIRILTGARTKKNGDGPRVEAAQRLLAAANALDAAEAEYLVALEGAKR